MFNKVLIANRGAVACRIVRTLRIMGVGSVAVYSDADRHSAHVKTADEAVALDPGGYMDIDRVLEAAKRTGAEAIHPGYGFLSENASFAEACESAGIRFIGPTPGQMRAFSLKHRAREIAESAGVPLLPGTGLLDSFREAKTAAAVTGYPVLLKATGGTGSVGMGICHDARELAETYESLQRLAEATSGVPGLYLEKFSEVARHIEVQVFGDGRGQVIALGERDCSMQRHNQKLVEETPAPGLTPRTRQALFAAAVGLCRKVSYRSAGTVEFMYDNASGDFYFLEANARLKAGHGVTEEVAGIDLVEWMIRLAAGDEFDLHQPETHGSAIQVRLRADDPCGHYGAPGTLTELVLPAKVRVETSVQTGSSVSLADDPTLALVIAHGRDRGEAVARMSEALRLMRLSGIGSNLDYLREIVQDREWLEGGVTRAYRNRPERSPMPDGSHAAEPIVRTT